MAEEIAEHCRQFVAAHADEYEQLDEDDAVDALARDFRVHAADLGWDESDYHTEVEALVRAGLRQRRNQ